MTAATRANAVQQLTRYAAATATCADRYAYAFYPMIRDGDEKFICCVHGGEDMEAYLKAAEVLRGFDVDLGDRDDGNRPDTTLDGLAGLPPSFHEAGAVTAGNAAPTADGTSCMLLASEAMVQSLGIEVLGWFTGYATVGCEPEVMAVGAARAIQKLLAAHRLAPRDIDLFEINEVFAAQILYCIRVLELDEQRVNVNGGAISLGHPFGMTGARLVGHAARELGRRARRLGVVAMCVGGGIGALAIFDAPCSCYGARVPISARQ